jgi:hypothetical protein
MLAAATRIASLLSGTGFCRVLARIAERRSLSRNSPVTPVPKRFVITKTAAIKRINLFLHAILGIKKRIALANLFK